MENVHEESMAEEQFIRCLNRLRRELNTANWHFEVYKSLKDAKKEYRKAMSQAAPFWGLTTDAHALLTLVLLNRFFDKKNRHLGVESVLSLAERNPEIFSDERFSDRLKKAGRFDRDFVDKRDRVTDQVIQLHRETLRDLPISGLRSWRNKLLAHIDKDWVVQNKDVRVTFRLNDKHIEQIIETVDNILNYYHGAYENSMWVKDIHLKNYVGNVLDLVRVGLEEKRRGYGL